MTNVLRKPDVAGPRLVQKESAAEARKGAPAEEAPAPVQPDVRSPGADAPTPPARRGGARKFLLGAVAIAAITAGGWYGYDWWVDGRFLVETDDAYVGADMATMAPKVSGYVASVSAQQNMRVKAGDPLVTLDDGDYRLALAAADGKIATQQASIARFDRQIAAADAQISQAKAQVDSANADSARAAADFDRAQQLAKSSYGSRQSLDQATADKLRTAASVEAAKAGVVSAEANRDVLIAQKEEAQRTLDELKTARAQRQRDLDATVIRAPFDGVVGNKAAQAGDYVTPGKRVMAIVPLDRVYVDANFKETQLADIQPGEKVRLSVDAYPEHDVTGVVDSLAPASGAQFSLLPPENATGNFTKIVQRVPVRIHVDPADVAKGRLRPGLSVIAAVDIRTAPKDETQSAAALAPR
ncbi:HlyD family secretion protein [Chelatococcus sambhunathii]|uniref:HlyD family secretion protein n=1 Tax=Chelatococcus sambhunathii TaxID=363953 RepID=A0ABU1DJM8_9HYPH|nr:HlyD family secretion protein [Chelatococcus sambhunathii]MDR4308215.1 HlyD family secretion protein [Chelatococcus sambhunathii]